jgi:nitroreductase
MIEKIIQLRRTIKPDKMNGRVIGDDIIQHLLDLADWAPTHGKTEPWRFIVYGNQRISEFCRGHAELYRDNTPDDKFNQLVFDKLMNSYGKASHIIVAYMKRGNNPNIPEIEEIAAASAAIQNILLGATANGIAAFWSTSGMLHKPVMKEHLGLREEDKMLGFLYLGYSELPLMEGKRIIPISEKIEWYR